MSDKKFLDHYVEVLTSTMTDCIIRNVSMQANAKVTEEVLKEQAERIQDYAKKLADLDQEVNTLKSNKSASESAKIAELNGKITDYERQINQLKGELSELNNKFRDYDSVKNQATHTDTFRNELLKAREDVKRIQLESNSRIQGLTDNYESKIGTLTTNYESTIAELTKKIDYLQLTPAQRRKVDALNKKEEPASVLIQASVDSSDESIKDGGTF